MSSENALVGPFPRHTGIALESTRLVFLSMAIIRDVVRKEGLSDPANKQAKPRVLHRAGPRLVADAISVEGGM